MPRAKPIRPSLTGNPEWENMKASRASISPAEGVRECALLTERWRRLWGKGSAINVEVFDLIRSLNKKKIPFVLTGAHGIASWTGRPRATKDVDILVKGGRNLQRAVNAIRALYPDLEVRDFYGVYAFFPKGETQSVIDVTYPHREDLQETLANPVWVNQSGHRYRVPSLEAALANKYGAMLTPNRNLGKRMVDIGDFVHMVEHSLEKGRISIDLDKLAILGEKVWPGGGGAELLRLVEYAKTGRGFSIDDLFQRNH